MAAIFAGVEDSRQPGKTCHPLEDVLFSALCATLCGYSNFSAMAEFTRLRLEWLKGYVGLPNGAPSHDVFRNVFLAVHPQAMAGLLGRLAGELAGRHVAVDGKVQRASRDGRGGSVHVLRAWVDELSISAGQTACSAKSNEIEAIPRLLESLELKGATVSIDAAGCQVEVAGILHAKGADYVLALKDNQPTTRQAVAGHFGEGAPGASRWSSEQIAHGKLIRREYAIQEDLSWWPKSWKWAGVVSVGHVRTTTVEGGDGIDGQEAAVEERYFITSLPGSDARAFASVVRGHWGVENRCHWTLDVTYGEDT